MGKPLNRKKALDLAIAIMKGDKHTKRQIAVNANIARLAPASAPPMCIKALDEYNLINQAIEILERIKHE